MALFPFYKMNCIIYTVGYDVKYLTKYVMVRILALDIASKTGWSVLDDDQYIMGGTEEFKYPTKAKKNKDIAKGKKWFDAFVWLRHQMQTLKPDYIVCEDVKRHTSSLAALCYGYLRYASEAAAYEAEIPFYPIGVGTWKKIATENGSSDKDEVQSAMTIHYPNVIWQSDDHSDSAGMAYAFKLLLDENRLDELLSSSGGKKKKEPKSKKQKAKKS